MSDQMESAEEYGPPMPKPRERLEAAIAEYGLSIRAEFIPWSKSRSNTEATPPERRNLNWRVTLEMRRPSAPSLHAEILTCDYSAGLAHAPSHKKFGGWAREVTLDAAQAFLHETETGTVWRGIHSGVLPKGKPILPDTADVIHSLVSDCDVLNYPTFEEWARSLGYDEDSRPAEKIYRACLEIALKLRNAIGEEGLRKLAEAGQDY